MKKCYICNKDFAPEGDGSANGQYAKRHKEHIIQNALFGRLKPSDILCESCGNDLGGEIDANFVNLFVVFTEQLKSVAIPKDHGTGSVKSLAGYLFSHGTETDRIKVIKKGNIVAPMQPHVEIDELQKKVTIFANRKRGKQHIGIVKKELAKSGHDPGDFQINIETDISRWGALGLSFSEDNPEFNKMLVRGLMKIATGFAIHKGVSRKELKGVLEFDENDRARYRDKPMGIIPFFPFGTFDLNYEQYRPHYEDNYPSHTLILFNEHYSDTSHALYCYIDLFSTFQYYVLLNDKYEGEDIYEVYYQPVLKSEKPEIDIDYVRPKELNIVEEALGVRPSEVVGMSIPERFANLRKAKEKWKPTYDLPFSKVLETVVDRVSVSITLSLEDNDAVRGLVPEAIIPNDRMLPSAFLEIKELAEQSFHLFRKLFFEDDGTGRPELMSTPLECRNELQKDQKAMQVYGHLKFQHLTNFIYEVNEKTKKDTSE